MHIQCSQQKKLEKKSKKKHRNKNPLLKIPHKPKQIIKKPNVAKN